MNSFKHTPGPWVAPLDNAGSKGRAVWTADGSSMICVCQSAGVSLGGEQANARLCAAAPDLLDALRLIMADVAGCQKEIKYEAARSAITKATGDDNGCL